MGFLKWHRSHLVQHLDDEAYLEYTPLPELITTNGIKVLT